MANDHEIDGLPQHALFIRNGSADDRGITPAPKDDFASMLQGFIIANEEDVTFDSRWRRCLRIGVVGFTNRSMSLGARSAIILLLAFVFDAEATGGIGP